MKLKYVIRKIGKKGKTPSHSTIPLRKPWESEINFDNGEYEKSGRGSCLKGRNRRQERRITEGRLRAREGEQRGEQRRGVGREGRGGGEGWRSNHD